MCVCIFLCPYMHVRECAYMCSCACVHARTGTAIATHEHCDMFGSEAGRAVMLHQEEDAFFVFLPECNSAQAVPSNLSVRWLNCSLLVPSRSLLQQSLSLPQTICFRCIYYSMPYHRSLCIDTHPHPRTLTHTDTSRHKVQTYVLLVCLSMSSMHLQYLRCIWGRKGERKRDKYK